MNDRQQSFRPLVDSSVHQFLADQVPSTVRYLFKVVNVLDLLTMYQPPKSATNLVIHRI